MTANQKVTLGLTMSGLGIAFLVYRSIQRNSLYKKINNAIGGVSSTDLNSWEVWFNHNYWQDKSDKSDNYIIAENAQLLIWADELDDAFETYSITNPFANDDEAKIYGVLRAVPDGVALSQLSEKYSNRHDSDLKNDLETLDGDEIKQVASILNQKPSHTPRA